MQNFVLSIFGNSNSLSNQRRKVETSSLDQRRGSTAKGEREHRINLKSNTTTFSFCFTATNNTITWPHLSLTTTANSLKKKKIRKSLTYSRTKNNLSFLFTCKMGSQEASNTFKEWRKLQLWKNVQSERRPKSDCGRRTRNLERRRRLLADWRTYRAVWASDFWRRATGKKAGRGRIAGVTMGSATASPG